MPVLHCNTYHYGGIIGHKMNRPGKCETTHERGSHATYTGLLDCAHDQFTVKQLLNVTLISYQAKINQ